MEIELSNQEIAEHLDWALFWAWARTNNIWMKGLLDDDGWIEVWQDSS